LAPAQAPALQVSPVVQASPSSHAVPSGFGVTAHVPVAGLQAATSWHASAAGQTTGELPWHTPALQLSVCVQALPSLHAAPSGLAETGHWPVGGSHAPTVLHPSEAGHATGSEPTQTPAWQTSVFVQAFQSLQSVPVS
jgi:hypothetical protein